MHRSAILSVGAYLPPNIMQNTEFEQYLNTSDEWIYSRTGIKTRHIVSPNETSASMGTEALRKALASVDMHPNELDGIIVATSTPSQTMPSTAIIIANDLGASNSFAFDINSACSGFVYAVHIANSLIESGGAENIAVIGTDSMSKIVDWNDRSTCVLFGDGAGAMILGRAKHRIDLVKTSGDKKMLTSSSGFLDSMIYADPDLRHILHTQACISPLQYDNKIEMNGKEVFKYAVREMSKIIKELSAGLKLEVDSVDFIIPHQANSRIIEAIGTELKLQHCKVINTLMHHANTSAATIPLAFADSLEKGIISIGSKELMIIVAVGAGMTAGGAIFAL